MITRLCHLGTSALSPLVLALAERMKPQTKSKFPSDHARHCLVSIPAGSSPLAEGPTELFWASHDTCAPSLGPMDRNDAGYVRVCCCDFDDWLFARASCIADGEAPKATLVGKGFAWVASTWCDRILLETKQRRTEPQGGMD